MASSLRFAPRAGRAAEAGYSFIAPKPALSGEPGERIAECTGAELTRRGNKHQLVLTFETEEGQTGRMWVELPKPSQNGSPFTPTCRYMRLVSLALGAAPQADTPIHPGSVFKGKTFRVRIGWRKSGAGDQAKKFDESLALVGPKDSKDFLRVHDLLEVLP